MASPSGLANDVERRFDYIVREPFAASFSCERENAKAPCTPLRPVQVRFNAPISRADAEKLTLKGPGGTISPTFKPDDKDSETLTVEFAAPLPEHAELTIEIPTNLKDVSGRALTNTDLFPLKTTTAPMPPLAKFSSGTFGIVERFAEPDMPALVPVTLRNVEADLHVAGLNAGNAQFTKLRVDADTDIRNWMRLVDRFDGYSMNRSTIDSLMPGLLQRSKNPVYVPRCAGRVQRRRQQERP